MDNHFAITHVPFKTKMYTRTQQPFKSGLHMNFIKKQLIQDSNLNHEHFKFTQFMRKIYAFHYVHALNMNIS